MVEQIPLVLLSILATSSQCWLSIGAEHASGETVLEIKSVANTGHDEGQLLKTDKSETIAENFNGTNLTNGNGTTIVLPNQLQATGPEATLSRGQPEQETNSTQASAQLVVAAKIIDEIVGESAGDELASLARNELEEEVGGGGESGASLDDDSVISASEILPNSMNIRPSWWSPSQPIENSSLSSSVSSSSSSSSSPEQSPSKPDQIKEPANRILFPISAQDQDKQQQQQRQETTSRSNGLLVFHQASTTPEPATGSIATSKGGGLNEHFLQVAAAAIGNELDPLADQEEGLDATANQQQTSRLLLQLLVLGLFILVSASLIIIYAIKFCFCRRGKERRLLRRALIGDLAANNGVARQSQLSSSLVTAIGLPTSAGQQHINNAAASLLLASRHQPFNGENIVLGECACQLDQLHQAGTVGSMGQNIDCNGGLHYFPATSLSRSSTPNSATETGQPSAPTVTGPIQQNSLVLSLIDRLQQSICAPMLAQQHQPQSLAADNTSPSAEHQHHHHALLHNHNHQQLQQQQLAQLIVAQLQAQLVAAGYFPAACICNQQHQPMASGSSPANRPPAYSDLFRHQSQQQQQQQPQQRQVIEAVASTAVAGSNEGA